MKFIKKLILRVRQALETINHLEQRFDEVRINQGIILSTLNEHKTATDLTQYEFKVFSQWGEDGIIQHLVNSIDIKNKTFIEFGVQDFLESNCRFLLMKDDWRGFVIDGSTANIQRLKNSYFYWKHQLDAVDQFITKENINELLALSGFAEDVGILSVDLDGNDYHILNAITNFKPRILICEYNPYFGGVRKITIPYDPAFTRMRAHYSNLYWGASLGAMTFLANKKGYSLCGVGSMGSNAFYVRNDLLNDRLRVMTSEEAYQPANVRESRDENGRLTFLNNKERLKVIKDLPVFEVEKEMMEVIS